MNELNRDRLNALKEASEKMVAFVNQYCTPHDIIVISQGSVELYAGEVGIPTELPKD